MSDEMAGWEIVLQDWEAMACIKMTGMLRKTLVKVFTFSLRFVS
jgi:hypothetical protein